MSLPGGTVALVTGANRGIGLEVARQLAALGASVVLGSRDAAAGEAEARRLAGDGLAVTARQLDVTDPASVERIAAVLEQEHGRLDVLVNNAALYPSGGAAELDMNVVESTLETNVAGPWRMAQAVIPLLRRSAHPRVANVSSEAGSLATMGGGHAAYAVSKAALNGVTRVLASALARDRVLVNSVCPGWVRTEMGGPSAPRSVEQGAASVVWAATLPDDGPSGGFFRDGRPLPW